MIYDSVLTCQICNQYMVDPVLIRSCFHTFCRYCAVERIRQNQSSCAVCGKSYNLDSPEAIVRDKILSRKLRQYAPEEYFKAINSDTQFCEKRVPSPYEVVVLRDNNLSGLLSSLSAPYEQISFCLKYCTDASCNLEQADSIFDHPSTSSEACVELDSGVQPLTIKLEPYDSKDENIKLAMTDGKHHKCGDGEVLFKRFYLAVALTSLKTLQLLLQRTLKTESNGFTLYFLDVDGKTALNSKWSIRDIGYIFGWDRESILTINFKLKSMPTFNSVESRLPEESVELNIISAPRTNAVQPLNESVNLTATAHSSKNSVKANISLKRKQVTSACKSWQKKHKRVTKILKPETRDDPVLVRRIRYILIHGHPPPDKASCTNSANSNKDAEKKSLKRLSNQATQTVSSLTIRKIGKRCKKLTTITLSSSLKSLPLKMTEETKSLKHNLPNELTDSISKPEVSTQRQAPSTVKQSAVSTRRRVSATNVNSAVSRSPDRSIPASSTSKKCGSSEDIPERSYAFNRKKKRLPASLCAYELRKRRLSPLPLPGLLARTVK